MTKFKITIPCMFGLESVLKKEISDLGYDIDKVMDGRVSFNGDGVAIARANISIRTGERILLNIGEFTAKNFDDLFDATIALNWEDYLPKNAAFPVVKASSVKSKVYSSSHIQSIVKKAVAERMKKKYKTSWLKEDGASYPIRVFIYKDRVSIDLDTSGQPLHKRGYRQGTGIAPISESLAAGLILLSYWNRDRILVDPLCGSGTIPIEAAMIGANIAPGLNREFISEDWTNLIEKRTWMDQVNRANEAIIKNCKLDIQAYDIDYRVLKEARINAENAYVDNMIHFQERDLSKFSNKHSYGVIITNPPYGKRMDKDVEDLYKEMGKVFAGLNEWSIYIISSHEGLEEFYGKKADKKRKLYSGMLRTNIYQYLGKRPKRLSKGLN